MATKSKKTIAKKTTKRATKKQAAPPAELMPARGMHVFNGGVGDHLRQGDVMLKRVEQLPKDAEKIAGGVVRHGSATGHSHRFDSGAQLHRAKDGRQFVEITADHADLVHEEHATIRVSGPAFYEHVQQREFSGEDERAVMD